MPLCPEKARLPVLIIVVRELNNIARAVLVFNILPSAGGSDLYLSTKIIPVWTPVPISRGITITLAKLRGIPASTDTAVVKRVEATRGVRIRNVR